MLSEVANGLLSNAVLEVRIYATKGELLLRIVACLLEDIVMESPMVAVVVQYLNPMFYGVLLKEELSGHCFCG
jgi:hypothetical protein